MSENFRDYRSRLQTEAEELAREPEAGELLNHFHSFNFGRVVGRLEDSREQFLRRLRWLFLGAAGGITLALIYFQLLLGARILSIGK